ncbi:MAG: RNA polymerase factor sigma-54 [Phycisphaeraceae bacterium]
MRIDTGQHLRIDQRMKLAPRMIQSMEILQMGQAALEERIEQELGSNPTLELQEPGDDDYDIEAERKQSERDSSEGERELVVHDSEGDSNAEDFERLSSMADEYSDSWSDNNGGGERFDTYASRPARGTGERDGKLDAMANTAARGASLHEQLMDQWRMIETDHATFTAGEHLLGYIDADGYLRTDRDTLIDQAPPGITGEDLDRALDRLQQWLEPPGLCARNLRECLLMQIDAEERADPTLDLSPQRELVENHLKDIENNRLPKIAKETGMDLDEVKAAILSLRHFHPHPGRMLASETPQAITPDAEIDYDDETDTYTARLTNDRLPPLQISPGYQDMAADKSTDKQTRDFIGGQLRSARWLLEAIEQRANTLLRVIGVVVEAQRDFFEQGEAALKPLPMTTVADQLGIHVATVSRAVSEKYIQTPRGIYPLRMFFSGGTETESGQSMSWTAVQAKLQTIVDEEDKSDPLSDDALVEKLQSQGIDIARRTVAKYRKQLNIPTARQRKQY